jgi:hypothetical protein
MIGRVEWGRGNRTEVFCDLDVNDGRRVTRARGSGATAEIEVIVEDSARGNDERGPKLFCDLDVIDCTSVGRFKQLAMSVEIEPAVMGLVRTR